MKSTSTSLDPYQSMSEEPVNFLTALAPDFFQAAPAPDFFQSSLGSGYFFSSGSGSKGSKACSSGSWLVVKFGKIFFPPRLLLQKKYKTSKLSVRSLNHKNLLFYLKKSNKCTISLWIYSSYLYDVPIFNLPADDDLGRWFIVLVCQGADLGFLQQPLVFSLTGNCVFRRGAKLAPRFCDKELR